MLGDDDAETPGAGGLTSHSRPAQVRALQKVISMSMSRYHMQYRFSSEHMSARCLQHNSFFIVIAATKTSGNCFGGNIFRLASGVGEYQ